MRVPAIQLHSVVLIVQEMEHAVHQENHVQKLLIIQVVPVVQQVQKAHVMELE